MGEPTREPGPARGPRRCQDVITATLR